MDKPEDEQAERTCPNSGQGVPSGAGHIDEDRGGSTQGVHDATVDVGDGVSWVHGQRIAPSPIFKSFLTSLRDGLEKMIEIDKAKIEELVKEKNRMGGK